MGESEVMKLLSGALSRCEVAGMLSATARRKVAAGVLAALKEIIDQKGELLIPKVCHLERQTFGTGKTIIVSVER